MPYLYKTLHVDGSVSSLDPSLLAEKVNKLINIQTLQGWEFYQINSVHAGIKGGCLDGLFRGLWPAASGATNARFDIAIFRKEVTQNDAQSMHERLQQEINSDTSKPHPWTHVRCTECKKLVRKEATQCRHCNCRLKPQ